MLLYLILYWTLVEVTLWAIRPAQKQKPDLASLGLIFLLTAVSGLLHLWQRGVRHNPPRGFEVVRQETGDGEA